MRAARVLEHIHAELSNFLHFLWNIFAMADYLIVLCFVFFAKSYREHVTKIENVNHTDDNDYFVDFKPKYSPVFFVLFDPIQNIEEIAPEEKVSYSRK